MSGGEGTEGGGGGGSAASPASPGRPTDAGCRGSRRLASSSGKSSVATQNRLKYYARRGLPDEMRPKVWMVLTGVDLILMERPGEYAELCRRALEGGGQAAKGDDKAHSHSGNSLQRRESDDMSTLTGDASTRHELNVLEQIEKDLKRTFANHLLFRDREEGGDGEGDGEGEEGDGSVDRLSDVDRSESDPEIKKDSDHGDSDHGDSDTHFDNEGYPRRMSNLSFGDPDEYLHSAPTGARSSASGWSSDTAREAALRRILSAYSVFDPQVGYCQGMNFIAAMFMTFLTEEESFWLLTVVMNEEPYLLRDLFGKDIARMGEVLHVSDKLVAQFLPRLARHLDAQGVHVSMYVTQWLTTLYTSTFPFDLVSRVWDSFLTEGWKIVYRVMLSLLKHASKDLLESPFEDILVYLRELPSEVDGQEIIKGSNKIPLKTKHIQVYVDQWRRMLDGPIDGGESPRTKPSKSTKHWYKRLSSIGSIASAHSASNGTSSASAPSPSRGSVSFGNEADLLAKGPDDGGTAQGSAAPMAAPSSIGSASANSVVDDASPVSVSSLAQNSNEVGWLAQDPPSQAIKGPDEDEISEGSMADSAAHDFHASMPSLSFGNVFGSVQSAQIQNTKGRDDEGISAAPPGSARGASLGREKVYSKIHMSMPHMPSASQLMALKATLRPELRPRPIEVEALSESLLPIVGAMKFAVLLHNVLTPAECSALIERAEDEGFGDASVIDDKGRMKRNCTQFVIEDGDLAGKWYERIVSALKLEGTSCHKKLMNASWMDRPTKNEGDEGTVKENHKYNAIGMNDRLRLRRYKKGQFNSPHVDTPVVWGESQRRASEGDCAGRGVEGAGKTSLATVHVYLNHKFKGGLTRFREGGRYLDVKAGTGSVLVFEHDLPYESQMVTQGKKYVVRSDVLYSVTRKTTFAGLAESIEI